jgi:hypothetical protein
MHDRTAQPTEPVSSNTTMNAMIPLPMARSLRWVGSHEIALRAAAHSENLKSLCLRSDACELLRV